MEGKEKRGREEEDEIEDIDEIVEVNVGWEKQCKIWESFFWLCPAASTQISRRRDLHDSQSDAARCAGFYARAALRSARRLWRTVSRFAGTLVSRPRPNVLRCRARFYAARLSPRGRAARRPRAAPRA